MVDANNLQPLTADRECTTCAAGTTHFDLLQFEERLAYLDNLSLATPTSRKTCQELCKSEGGSWCRLVSKMVCILLGPKP